MRLARLVAGLCIVAVPASAAVFCSIHERIDKVGEDGEGVLHICARRYVFVTMPLLSAVSNDCTVAKPS